MAETQLKWRKPRVRKGVFYFPDFMDARAFVLAKGFPTSRIVSYQFGWAIQLRISGPYVGPELAKA